MRNQLRRKLLPRRFICVASAVLIASACGDEGATMDIAVRDSSGIRIVENPADAPAAPAWWFGDEAVVDIGGDAADPEAQLFRVAGAVRLSNGRIVIGDGGSSTLKVFSAEGVLIDELGGPGEGPGEFQRLNALYRLPGDSILTQDIGLLRFIVFDPAGRPAREFKLMAPDGPASATVIGVLRDGAMVGQGFVDLGGRPPSGLERHMTRLYLFSPAGEQLAELGEFPTGEIYFVSFDRGFSTYEPFFHRQSHRVAAGDRVVIGDTDRYELRFLALDGTTTMLARRDVPARRVTSADARRALELRLAGEADDDGRTELERVLADIPIPETMPAFGRVHADDDGNLWVERYRAPGEDDAVWSVFDPDGRLLAALPGPTGFRPTHIGDDFALGTWRDELDVEHVRLYALSRAGLR